MNHLKIIHLKTGKIKHLACHREVMSCGGWWAGEGHAGGALRMAL